jgi:hypothetical protein
MIPDRDRDLRIGGQRGYGDRSQEESKGDRAHRLNMRVIITVDYINTRLDNQCE